MELLRIMAGWTRVPLADGVHLRSPASMDGSITVRPQVSPIPTLRGLAGAAAVAVERFVTLEGEHAILASAGERTLAIVVGDLSAGVVDGRAHDRASAAAVPALVRELAANLFLGLGEVRRRRFVYAPPTGWSGNAIPHAARWHHPRFPRTPHLLTVFDARPRRMIAPELVDRLLFCDGTHGRPRDAPEPLAPVTNGAGLSGVLARIGYRAAEGGPHMTVVRATLADDRFDHVVELEGPTATVSEDLGTLLTLIESIEAVPRPRLDDIAEKVIYWGD